MLVPNGATAVARQALATAARLLAHLRALSRDGGHVLRWRLETYGLYMPSYPHQRPWWALNPFVAAILGLRLGRYSRWLEEMDRARVAGAGFPAPWRRRLSPAAEQHWQTWMALHNDPDREPLDDSDLHA